MADRAFYGSSAGTDHVVGVNQAGISLALIFGCLHLTWSLLVLTGTAQAVMDFVFWLHFISPGWTVERFEIGRAIGLILLTSAIGYVVGATFAILWTRLNGARA